MKSIFLFTALAFISLSLSSQELPGFRTSNYNGVLGVYSNPANASQNNYSWDVSLLTFGAGIGNNNASFGLKNISDLTDENAITDKLIGDGRSASALFSTDIKPISVLISLNRKSGIALTTRARVMLNATDLDGALAKQIADGSSNISFPYSVNSDKDMRITANGWSEVGLTYGYVLMEKGKHFVKAGVTAKYLAGVANAYANVNKLKATLTQNTTNGEVFLTDATGGLEIGTAGVSLDDFSVEELTSFKSTGLGADLGFIYEYRPGVKAGKKKSGNHYKLKLGLSLTDIGSIKYEKNPNNSAGYNINTGNPGLNIQELADQPIDDMKEYLDSNPQYFTPKNSSGDSYNVSLPTMLNLDVDYKVMGKFYVNAATNLNLLSNSNKAFNNSYYNTFSVTPRLEIKSFGLFVPVNYNALTNLNAGIAIKFGPLFLGSGSALTAALKESKQADLFFGIRFGSFAN